MHKSIISLGIESSCYETSIGVIKVDCKDNILFSEKNMLSLRATLITPIDVSSQLLSIPSAMIDLCIVIYYIN